MEQSVLGQPYQPSMSEIAIDRILDSGASAGWQHEYRILDLPAVNGVAAETNGHVHRLGPTWRKVSSERSIRVEPRLAVSSNALRHPKDLEVQDLTLSAAIEQHIAGDAARAWWLALYVDDRFGDMRLYPGLYAQVVSRTATSCAWDFPIRRGAGACRSGCNRKSSLRRTAANGECAMRNSRSIPTCNCARGSWFGLRAGSPWMRSRSTCALAGGSRPICAICCRTAQAPMSKFPIPPTSVSASALDFDASHFTRPPSSRSSSRSSGGASVRIANPGILF